MFRRFYFSLRTRRVGVSVVQLLPTYIGVQGHIDLASIRGQVVDRFGQSSAQVARRIQVIAAGAYEADIDPIAGCDGFRIFFTRWLAATLEVRDLIYFEKLENLAIAANPLDELKAV